MGWEIFKGQERELFEKGHRRIQEVEGYNCKPWEVPSAKGFGTGGGTNQLGRSVEQTTEKERKNKGSGSPQRRFEIGLRREQAAAPGENQSQSLVFPIFSPLQAQTMPIMGITGGAASCFAGKMLQPFRNP